MRGKIAKSCHVFDLIENKKTLGHGKKGERRVKVPSQLCLWNFRVLRAFRTNAEKWGQSSKDFEPMFLAINCGQLLILIKSLKKEIPWGTGQNLPVASQIMLVGYITIFISTPSSIQVRIEFGLWSMTLRVRWLVVNFSHPFHGYGKTGMLISSMLVDWVSAHLKRRTCLRIVKNVDSGRCHNAKKSPGSAFRTDWSWKWTSTHPHEK